VPDRNHPKENPMSTPAWPASVIARYLTVGGAHVDISVIADSTSHSVFCSGCQYDSMFTSGGLSTYVTEQTEQEARRWAQAHAETCRAMPRPTA
jgi:hypothetical protein